MLLTTFCLFQNHIVSELSKRECNKQPSARDMKIIAMQAEIEQHMLRDVKSNQLIDEMARTIQELEDQVPNYVTLTVESIYLT